MGKVIRKIRFIDAWRIGENESWLSDMAAGGLHLTKYGRIFACFERGEQKKYLYRIDISFSELTDDYISMFAEGGWEFVSRSYVFNVFRSPKDSNAPELHTDPAEQSYTLRKLVQRFITSTLLSFLAIISALLSLYFSLSIGNTPVLRLLEGASFNMFIMSLYYLYLLFISLQAVFSIKKLIRSMRFGYPINHTADWKRYKRLGVILLISAALLSFLCVCIPFLQLMLRHDETLPFVSDNQMILRLSDIEEDDNIERSGSHIIENIDWGNKAVYRWSLFAPIQINVNENGIIKGRMWSDKSGKYSPSVEYRLFRLRFPFLADSLVTDLTNRMTSWYSMHNEKPVITEIKNSGVDKLQIREYGNFREVFAVKGSFVVYVRYYGEKTIENVYNSVLKLMIGF